MPRGSTAGSKCKSVSAEADSLPSKTPRWTLAYPRPSGAGIGERPVLPAIKSTASAVSGEGFLWASDIGELSRMHSGKSI